MTQSDSKVSSVLFEIMQIEIINHVKNQHELQPYLDAGLDPHQAQDIIKQLMADKFIAMGHHIGRRIALRLLEQEPKPQSLQGDAGAPFRFLAKEIWSAVFNKSADSCVPLSTMMMNPMSNPMLSSQAPPPNGTPLVPHVLKENSFFWTSRFSPSSSSSSDPDGLDGLVLPYVLITAGIIKGALSALGEDVEVSQDIEIKHKAVCVIFRILPVPQIIRSV